MSSVASLPNEPTTGRYTPFTTAVRLTGPNAL
jgi:hypothetical protein